MRGFAFGSALVLAVTPLGVAQASDWHVLQPSSNWQVDYAEDYCKLARQFGNGDDRVFMLFYRYEPGETFRMTLAGKPFRLKDATGEAEIQFGEGHAPQKLEYYRGNMDGFPALILKKNVQLIVPVSDKKHEQEAEATVYQISKSDKAAMRTIAISSGLQKKMQLQTGPLDKPFAALDNCTDDLLTHWGIDVEKHKTLSRRATPANDPSTWLRANDYPRVLLTKRRQAIVNFRLMVGTDGRVESCHIQQLAGLKEFGITVCRMMRRRARFDPALDAEGQPIKSYHISYATFLTDW